MVLQEKEVLDYEQYYENYMNTIMKTIHVHKTLRNEEIEECIGTARREEDEIALRILVNTFNQLTGNLAFMKLKHKIVRGGFIVGFNIHKITNKQFDQYQDSNKIRIHGCKKGDIEKYWIELSFRRKAMEKIINEQYDEGIQGEHYDERYDKK